MTKKFAITNVAFQLIPEIIPPIVEECPADIVHVVTSRSEVEVALPNIVFRSSISGVILNHVCKDVDLKESHNLFPVGLHNIRCFASEPGEPIADSSSISHCNITIHVEGRKSQCKSDLFLTDIPFKSVRS